MSGKADVLGQSLSSTLEKLQACGPRPVLRSPTLYPGLLFSDSVFDLPQKMKLELSHFWKIVNDFGKINLKVAIIANWENYWMEQEEIGKHFVLLRKCCVNVAHIGAMPKAIETWFCKSLSTKVVIPLQQLTVQFWRCNPSKKVLDSTKNYQNRKCDM